MKKLFSLQYLLFTVFTLYSFYSCSDNDLDKEESSLTSLASSSELLDIPDSVIFAVENNTLVFESMDEYNICCNYLDAIGDDSLDVFEQTVGYTSYRSENGLNVSDTFSIADPLFATLINPDAEIIIQGYKVKINFDDETTLVYEADDSTSTNSSGIKTSSNISPITTLSWTDDFSYFLNGNTKSLMSSYCKSSKGKSVTLISKNVLDDYYTSQATASSCPYLEAKLKYQKFSIYKSMILKLKLNNHSSFDGNYKIYGHVYYLGDENDNYYKIKNKSKKYINYDKQAYLNYTNGDKKISKRFFNTRRRVQYFNVEMGFVAYILDADLDTEETFSSSLYTNLTKYSTTISISCNN